MVFFLFDARLLLGANRLYPAMEKLYPGHAHCKDVIHEFIHNNLLFQWNFHQKTFIKEKPLNQDS